MSQKEHIEIAECVLEELNHFGRHFQPGGVTIEIILNEHKLKVEPFIGYMEVSNGNGSEKYLLCRNYTPMDFMPSRSQLEFASYLALLVDCL